MKKIIAVILSLILVTVCIPFTAFADTNDTLCFAVASDLHYNQPEEEFEHNNEDEIFYYANRRAAMENESGFIIDEFLKQCAEDSSVRYVLISGDMADNGRTDTDEHRDVAEKLRKFEAETGKDVFVINGNHDAAADGTTTYDVFKSIYADFGYDKALETRSEDCSYTANLGDKYRLIALDTNNPDESTEDGMNASKMLWVKKQAEKAYADGRYPILMMHHNLLDHMPLQRLISHDFIVRFHCSTASLFADWGIKLVFSGHEHCSDATTYTSASGNVIYDFATTSLTMYPLQYRLITLSDGKIDYAAKTVDSIDTAALKQACPQYEDKQLKLMNEGLNSYAKRFLQEGVEYRLELSLTMEKMGIKESDIYYKLVKTAVDGLTDILRMPLYGENSVQELAKEYNIDIPDSDYENAWELVTSLVALHYAGEESCSLDSAEIKILLRTAALIFRTDLPAVNDEVFMSAATEILNNMGYSPLSESLTKVCASVFGGVKPFEYFTVALLSPFLYEFAYDSDGVNDNNGTLTGYTQQSGKINADNILLNAKRISEKIILYVRLILETLASAFTKK